MPTNIEIKARARAPERQRELAAALSDAPPQKLEQTDTYFHDPRGRCKVRECDGMAELIYYERGNVPGPKPSKYVRLPVAEPAGLKRQFAETPGLRGVVRKVRHLYMVANTRIHFDDVEDLGSFIELEVVLAAEQTDAQGRLVADDLMNKLEIDPADLIAESYIDLLTAGKPSTG